MADLQVVQHDRQPVTDIEVGTPQEMALRMADMKSKLGLVQRFFKEVMVPSQDYGVIPGTEKPTLLKPGAEKLCELYGYAPMVKNVDEVTDRESGFYRARVTVALMHRKSGTLIAEGVGEANTSEGRYRWRWVPEWKLPQDIDKKSLHCEERTGKKGNYTMYRLENEDPWTLWNTVLKMAKKRALVDAALSATRSSGLFTQDVEDLREWVSGADDNYQSRSNGARSTTQGTNGTQNNPGPRNPNAPSSEAQQRAIHAIATKKGLTNGDFKLWLSHQYSTEHVSTLTMGQASDLINYLQDIPPQELQRKVEELSGQETIGFGDQPTLDDQINFDDDEIPF